MPNVFTKFTVCVSKMFSSFKRNFEHITIPKISTRCGWFRFVLICLTWSFLDVLILSIQQLCTLFEKPKISINHKFKIIIVRTNYNQQTKKMHQFFFYVCSINCTKSNITHTIYICIQIPRKH